MATTTPPTFAALVRDRSGILFEGQVRAISTYNTRGLLDVLPTHANFITVIKKKLILHKLDGSKSEVNVDSGVMRVLLGNVEVYVGVK